KQAINRFEGILEAFPEYYFRDEAYYYLGKAYLEELQPDKAKNILNKLSEEFPGSHYTKKGQKLLKKELKKEQEKELKKEAKFNL
ncbi:MAG: tetratricopeptide repeat protein, partial [Desulfuromusa sp.]|nr:tetratricopeptide repeat protein [Desulfuromusa sp.]